MDERALAEADQVIAELGIFDLHVDTLIPLRLWGYDPLQRHGTGLLRGRFFGHMDLPRMTDAGVRGAMWSLTTNPFRTAAGRWKTWAKSRTLLEDLVSKSGGKLAFAHTPGACAQLMRQRVHAVVPAVQGANAWEAAPNLDVALADRWVVRATLVHLTDSVYGTSSSPLSRRATKGLSAAGHILVETLDHHRVWVDLAHADEKTFWDAVQAHNRQLPLIATHTGLSGVLRHWRNLDDAQVKAIADSGGVVGVIAASNFLVPPGEQDDLDALLRHVEHAIAVGGEAVAAIGTDLDGAIVPPPALRDGLGHRRLVAAMLARKWSAARIQAVCAGNYLSAWQRLRPG